MPTDVTLPIHEIAGICGRYRVRELSLFGSAAAGCASPHDIDLLVEFDPRERVGLLALLGMQEELESLLQCRVDLVPKAGLKPGIRESVLSAAQVIYES